MTSPYHLYGITKAGSVIIEYLLEKGGIPHKVSYPNADERAAPSFRAYSPRGQIPVLVTPEGHGFSESLAIILYLLDQHPELELLPQHHDPKRATAMQWLSFLAVNLYTANQRLYQTHNFNGDEAVIRKGGIKDRLKIYDELETALAADGPYFCGGILTATDLYGFMLLNWDGRVDQVLSTRPHLAQWHDKIASLDYVKRVDARQPERL